MAWIQSWRVPRGIALVCMTCMACLACQANETQFYVQGSGDFLTYLTLAPDIEICEGNVTYAERWMRGVAEQLGIDGAELLPTNYHLVDAEELAAHCGSAAACTQRGDGSIEIYATRVLRAHELVHAVQFSQWPAHRAVLAEGLAVVYDDTSQQPLLWNPISSAHLDELLEAHGSDAPGEVYTVGGYLVYWLLQRHGPAKLAEFWLADAASGSHSAAAFRAGFEQHFGESLDAMIADVQDSGPACVIPTCVDDLVEWQGDRWTFESPQACGGTVRGTLEGDTIQLEQSVLLEITQVGSYQVSVTDGQTVQGAILSACSVWCGGDDRVDVHAGQVVEVDLQPGRYRVTTFKLDAQDPGVSVEIRPAG